MAIILPYWQKVARHLPPPSKVFGVAGRIYYMQSAQIFGVKRSSETRAAERFFKERRIQIHLVDLAQKPMSPAEIKRFIDRFGLSNLIETESKAYAEAGLKYLKVSDAELIARIETQPKLLKLPFVRCANRLSIGKDEEAWAEMLQEKK